MDRKNGFRIIRELSGFLLLLVLLLAGLLASWHLGRQHTAIALTLEDSTWLALSGQWENARKTVDGARTDWEKNRNIRAALMDHKPIEEINGLFRELKVCGAAGERAEFARICGALSEKIGALADGIQLHWWNLL